MRRILISALCLAAGIAGTVPAAAQVQRPSYGYGDYGGNGLEGELALVQNRIRMAFERHLISGREADKLTRDAARIEERLRHKGRDGLSFREREDIQRRINALRDRLRLEGRGRHRDW